MRAEIERMRTPLCSFQSIPTGGLNYVQSSSLSNVSLHFFYPFWSVLCSFLLSLRRTHSDSLIFSQIEKFLLLLLICSFLSLFCPSLVGSVGMVSLFLHLPMGRKIAATKAQSEKNKSNTYARSLIPWPMVVETNTNKNISSKWNGLGFSLFCFVFWRMHTYTT